MFGNYEQKTVMSSEFSHEIYQLGHMHFITTRNHFKATGPFWFYSENPYESLQISS